MKKNKLGIYVLLCVVLFGLVNCGRKRWPSPIVKQEQFSFSDIRIIRNGRSFQLMGKVLGNIHNLDSIVLQMETGDNICKRCPFHPNYKVIYPVSSPNLRFKGNSFTLIYMSKSGVGNIMRIRLLGINRFNTLPPVYSNIILVKE